MCNYKLPITHYQLTIKKYPLLINNYNRKNLLNKAILMKKELWLLNKELWFHQKQAAQEAARARVSA